MASRILEGKTAYIEREPAIPIDNPRDIDSVPCFIRANVYITLRAAWESANNQPWVELLVLRRIVIEGIQEPYEPREIEKAMRCAVTIMGGKRLLLQFDNPTITRLSQMVSTISLSGEGRLLYKEQDFKAPTLARVFLNEKVHGDPVGYYVPAGYPRPRLELGTFWQWLQSRGFEYRDVANCLNGRKEDRRAHV